MTVHLTQLNACPTCKTKLDAATNITEDTAPAAGDITVCAYCTSLLEFKDDGTLEAIQIETLQPDMQEIINEVIDSLREIPKGTIH